MSKTVLGALLAGCAGLLIAVPTLLRGRGIPEVNFQHVASSGRQPGVPADSLPALRVAISAMISPGVTRRYYEELVGLVGDKVDRRTELVQRKTYAEVNDLVESRAVDVAFVCSGPYVLGHDKFGMEILAIPVVDGASVYYSYILANVGSRMSSMDELRGKLFAFTDPDSNTGCLVPRYMVAKLGATPESFFRGTFFTHSHDNSIKAVAEGMADGAAVDSLIWEFFKATDPNSVSRTKVIHKSPPYGIPPMVVHPSLDPLLKSRLRRVLLGLHQDPAGRSLLDKIRVERFVEGDDALYASVREMQVWLAGER